jgi:hypothetical protein
MTCNNCEFEFQLSQTIILSFQRIGTDARLFVQNRGRNIVQLRRILLCSTGPGGGSSTLFLRPPPLPISWDFPFEDLEPGNNPVFFFQLPLFAGAIVQAQAEYVEIDGRSRSCPETI